MKKNKDRSYYHFLEDINISMNRVSQYLKDTPNFESFSKDTKTIDAVVRNFEIIGEASKNLPAEFKERNSHIPWQKMYVLRNILSHEYFGINLQILWEIATVEIKETKEHIETLLKSLKDKNNDKPI